MYDIGYYLGQQDCLLASAMVIVNNITNEIPATTEEKKAFIPSKENDPYFHLRMYLKEYLHKEIYPDILIPPFISSFISSFPPIRNRKKRGYQIGYLF